MVSTEDTGTLEKDEHGYVDFSVVKATESLTDNIILEVIEVKVNDARIFEHGAQVEDYMMFARSKNQLPKMKGYLVAGDRVHVWQFVGQGASADYDQLTDELTMDQFLQELHDLAGTQWNVTV
ncbi:hypothetical protein DXG03_007589 [Asterophora parasitica]|uniref:Uncharacterized protein n=1 Tax=Asterophora parasitica TaxID=117018 RepID=A0A9P7FZ17_9AGAR|nr:hypothetical protein DXG03_007589 [Asterophora parasitica]